MLDLGFKIIASSSSLGALEEDLEEDFLVEDFLEEDFLVEDFSEDFSLDFLVVLFSLVVESLTFVVFLVGLFFD